MTFAELYQVVIEKWPEAIDISIIKFHPNGGATIPSLSAAHDQVENQCLTLGKDVMAMDWAVFQASHAEAQRLYKNGVFSLAVKDVDRNLIGAHYNENRS